MRQLTAGSRGNVYTCRCFETVNGGKELSRHLGRPGGLEHDFEQ